MSVKSFGGKFSIAGGMEAQFPESVCITRGWHMGHVNLAPFQILKLLKCRGSSGVYGGSQCKCYKGLFQVQTYRCALKDIFLEICQRLEDSTWKKLHIIRYASQLFGGRKDNAGCGVEKR